MHLSISMSFKVKRWEYELTTKEEKKMLKLLLRSMELKMVTIQKMLRQDRKPALKLSNKA